MCIIPVADDVLNEGAADLHTTFEASAVTAVGYQVLMLDLATECTVRPLAYRLNVIGDRPPITMARALLRRHGQDPEEPGA